MAPKKLLFFAGCKTNRPVGTLKRKGRTAIMHNKSLLSFLLVVCVFLSEKEIEQGGAGHLCPDGGVGKGERKTSRALPPLLSRLLVAADALKRRASEVKSHIALEV